MFQHGNEETRIKLACIGTKSLVRERFFKEAPPQVGGASLKKRELSCIHTNSLSGWLGAFCLLI